MTGLFLLVLLLITWEQCPALEFPNCYTEYDRRTANSFLKTPRSCCDEDACEEQPNTCHTREFQVLIRDSLRLQEKCKPGQVVRVSSFCVDHIGYDCKDVCRDPLEVPDCDNGGTCVPSGNTFSCNCPPGFHGSLCENDIDECQKNLCVADQTTSCHNTFGGYICHCKHGYTGKNCEIDVDECQIPICIVGHTKTCTNLPGSYRCTCKPGYTGRHCETDIDECASSPCQNGASCNDLVNMYKCVCVGRFYGVNCDTNICHPTPADVIFVLDSSVSMTAEEFRKQLSFINTFIDHVRIGPNDFQISVVTYSFDARVEFYLDKYADNVTLKQSVNGIQYRPGATFTDKGLDMADKVFSSGHGTARRPNGTIADRFIFLLTDGLSTDRVKTADAARRLKDKYRGYGLKVSVIGIGPEVSHKELLQIASDPALVYSVQDFDSLYTVLKGLVHYTCDECRSSSVTDVALLVDTSNDVTSDAQFLVTEALSHLIDNMGLTPTGTHVSLTSYDVNITERVEFLTKPDTARLHVQINKMMFNEPRNVTILDVMRYVETTAFSNARPDSKKIAIIFSNGNFTGHPDLAGVKNRLKNNNITSVSVGSGPDVNVVGLATLVNDVFDVYLTQENRDFTNLDVLKSYMTYNVCELKGE